MNETGGLEVLRPGALPIIAILAAKEAAAQAIPFPTTAVKPEGLARK